MNRSVSVQVWRHGCTAVLSVDGGEGRHYNDTFNPCSHHWLAVDKQEGVYAGGKAEYTGVRTFDVHGDFHSGKSTTDTTQILNRLFIL